MSGMRRLSVTIGADPPARLDKAIARDVPAKAGLSRSRLAKLIDAGGVLLNGAPVTGPRQKVAEGDVLDLVFEEATQVAARPEAIPLRVVYEDSALIVVDKPVGMVVHPAPGSPAGTLVNALLHHCGDSLSGIGGEKRPGIVHRIDKDTSGLLVVAKTDKAHTGLAAQFERHSVVRRYLALCHGVPDAGDPRLRGLRGVSFEGGNVLKITSQLARHKTDRQKQAVTWAGGRHAVTRARVTEAFGRSAALLECWLETGRTHQIRVHMAYVGHGLIGDGTYGGRRQLSARNLPPSAIEAAAAFPRQALHAAELGFEHPENGEFLQFHSEIPEDMRALAQLLRNGVSGTTAD